MNIQTTQMKMQKKQIKEHSDWSIYCRIILKLIMFLLAVFAVANSYIYLNQQIQNIERDNTKITRKIENIDREIKSLQNSYENASSRSMIDRQIARFNLKLREADHSQIKKISLNDGNLSGNSLADVGETLQNPEHSNYRRDVADAEPHVTRH